jgi:3-oxoacyl-[acyl-carrier-protein] synthase-3
MMTSLPLKIAGVGRYLPQRVVANSEVEALAGLPAGWIERKNGVLERRWVENETASFMAAEAAREALDDAGMKPTELDLIINASGTQEQAIPDGAPLVQRQLGLGKSGIACMSIHATCLSFLVALDMASTLIATGRYNRILIVASEITSVGLNFKEPESSSLFGDAAAAAVVTRTPENEASCVHCARLETYGEGAYLTEVRGCGTRRPPNGAETKPEDNLFHMEGPKVFMLAVHCAAPFLERLRPGLSKELGDIRVVIPHQASLLALRAFRKFGMPMEKVVVSLDRLGNCVSASIPVTLYQAIRQGTLRRGDQALLVGTGAGLSIGGLILTY